MINLFCTRMLCLCMILCFISRTHTCYLWGTDSGECVGIIDQAVKDVDMAYCGAAVQYPVCIPKRQELPPSREFPLGRWGTNHSMRAKDAWVKEQITYHVAKRVALEKNVTLRKSNKNEYGDLGKIKRRFNHRPDCVNAYKNLFCWMNFPRCDESRDLTLPMCRSACENFFKACGYEKGLWRCGQSKFFNGYAPEEPIVDAITGEVQYLREYFPGQPWRENKYTTGDSELPICTPAITGSASRTWTGTTAGHYTLFLSAILVGIFLHW